MIPESDVKQVREWADRRVAPEHRESIRIEVDETSRGLTIFECRPPWREFKGSEWTRRPLARLSYSGKRKEWTLYWTDRNGRFQRYWDCEPTEHIGELLDEIDEDPTCIFWG